jgi:hypothetical protein
MRSCRDGYDRHAVKKILIWTLGVLAAYWLIAYVVVPLAWHRYENRHPALAGAPTITTTGSGIPGDPVNLGLIGSEAEIHRAMLAAKWHPADPITLESSLRIAADVVFDRTYSDAPVSNLYLFGRKEDLAFEQAVGSDPTRRHHVRFWRSEKLDGSGEPLWFGAATLDQRVGLSYTTGQITHHIGPDVDLERDKVVDDVKRAGDLGSSFWVDGFQKELQGKNGGGDPWRTDGRLLVGVIVLK